MPKDPLTPSVLTVLRQEFYDADAYRGAMGCDPASRAAARTRGKSAADAVRGLEDALRQSDELIREVRARYPDFPVDATLDRNARALLAMENLP